jgi:dienelactone hydrolase
MMRPLRPAAFVLMGALAIGGAAHAADRVQFESARYQIGPLQRRLALERHEPLLPAPVSVITGFLTKPEGPGPFAALVHLHGCGGLPAAVKSGTQDHFWATRLATWGYVVLVVDSFTSRGIDNTCDRYETALRAADAYGALAWLARQPFVDGNRIAVIGFSAGGIATLSIAESRDFELFENEDEHRFKAAIAFYPACMSANAMRVPTLILTGELDDWSAAAACRATAARRAGGSPVKLIVYPGTHHSFDDPRPGRRYFGHWLEYNAAAAEAASEEVRRFLAEHLSR